MKTIIVPVDFSSASLNAVNYALNFAYTFKANITLLHVCQVPVAVSEAPVAAAAYTAVIDDAEKKILEWKEDMLHKCGGRIQISTEVREGFVATQLQEICQKLHPYAVIIGSGNKTATERLFFGSSTLSVMKHVSYPVIIVPQGALFTAINRIGIACDLRNVADTIHAVNVIRFVQDFHAQLHILHVNTEPHKMIEAEEIEGSEWLRDMFKELKPEFHFLNKVNIEEAINDFAETKDLDLLIIIPKKHGLIEGIFHKSLTKEIALQTHIPLLSIHE